MIVEFLGQGIHQDEKETIGNYICSSFNEELFTEITVFVAFLRKPGLNILKPYIETAIKQNRVVRFFVGIDERVTSKEALELLIDLGVESYIYFSNSYIFHPKVYLFEGKRNRIITGSSNATKAGLLYNVESSILLDFTDNDKAGLKVLNQLKNYFSPLLEYTDSNLEIVTSEKINSLFQEGFISTENFDSNEDYIKNIHDKSKKQFKPVNEDELGNIEIKENRPYKKYDSILKITDDYLEKWDMMFERMKSFHEEFQNCTVPRDYKDRTLYGWYRKQKELKNNDLIPKEHLEKLNTINFYFGDSHDVYWDKLWLDNYNQLYQIFQPTGKSNLIRYKDNTHPLFKLSNWVAMERGKYNQEPKKIKDWQIEKLESIGFKWVMKRVANNETLIDDWLDRVALLEDYKQEFGDCNISQMDKNQKYKGLGKWLNDQRDANKRNRLQKDRIDLLESIGVVWDMDVFNFEKRIKQLLEYKSEHGDFNIPIIYPKDSGFGYYIYRIKTKGLKEKWKINKLHEIGFFEIGVVEKKENIGHITLYWYNMFAEIKKLDNPDIPRDYKPNPKLGVWLATQKKAFRHDMLKAEQIEKLKQLGIKLEKDSNKNRRWKDNIDLIELFIGEYGNSEITEDFDKELYEWIKQQKINIQSGKLKKDKENKLRELKVI